MQMDEFSIFGATGFAVHPVLETRPQAGAMPPLLRHSWWRKYMQKPKTLNEILNEKDLCQRLDLPVTKCGRSLQLSGWIRGGLEFVEKSGRRFFFEQDVVEYLWKRSQVDQPE
jgi:hypothetical protein